MRRTIRDLGALLVGLILGAAVVSVFAQQAPAPADVKVPDWVVIYAQGQEKDARDCKMLLAQETDKMNKIARELSDAKAAAAKVAPPEPKK